ncbi:hypothetical protein [Erythrobacter aureus]|nr:hypothetical protein [Erythrobacter aureus]
MIFLYVGSLMILAIVMIAGARARADATTAAGIAALKRGTALWLTFTVSLFFAAVGCVLIYLYPTTIFGLLLSFSAG